MSVDFQQAAVKARAAKLCTYLEEKLRPIGWHVGLTGSCLYGMGKRAKPDIDIIFYPNNDTEPHDETADELFEAAGIKNVTELGLSEDYQRAVFVTTTRKGDTVHFFIFP